MGSGKGKNKHTWLGRQVTYIIRVWENIDSSSLRIHFHRLLWSIFLCILNRLGKHGRETVLWNSPECFEPKCKQNLSEIVIKFWQQLLEKRVINSGM